MRHLIFGLLLTISITGFSQSNQILVLNNERILGRSLVDSSVIKGLEFTFPERIHVALFDASTGYLTAQLRGLRRNRRRLTNDGSIVKFDINNRKVVWSKLMNFQFSHIRHVNNTLIKTEGIYSTFIDADTGRPLWQITNNLLFADPHFNIGLGYNTRISRKESNTLEGINLNYGNVVWERYLNREFGWNNLFYLNDSTIMVVADGLNKIDLQTGKGWSYHTITGQKDYGRTAATNVLGIASGLLTGAFFFTTGHDIINGIMSNTLRSCSYIYFASKEQLAKIDLITGEIVWKSTLPDDLVSSSNIFMNDSVIFMVNRGVAFMGLRALEFGKPFFAAFDRHTGEQIFFTLMDDTYGTVQHSYIRDRYIFKILGNKVLKFSKDSGALIAKRNIPQDAYGVLRYFVGERVYISNPDGNFMNIRQTDTNNVFVFTSLDKVLSLGEYLQITTKFEFEDISVNFLQINDFRLIARGSKTWVVDQAGKKIAEIEASRDAFLAGNTLYDYQENRFLAIDLSEILPKE